MIYRKPADAQHHLAAAMAWYMAALQYQLAEPEHLIEESNACFRNWRVISDLFERQPN